MHWCDIGWYGVLVVDMDFPQRPSESRAREGARNIAGEVSA
jgi:hypothetical protein